MEAQPSPSLSRQPPAVLRWKSLCALNVQLPGPPSVPPDRALQALRTWHRPQYDTVVFSWPPVYLKALGLWQAHPELRGPRSVRPKEHKND